MILFFSKTLSEFVETTEDSRLDATHYLHIKLGRSQKVNFVYSYIFFVTLVKLRTEVKYKASLVIWLRSYEAEV